MIDRIYVAIGYKNIAVALEGDSYVCFNNRMEITYLPE